MGVLNVTPDSFSDGGFYFDPQKAFSRALEMISEGADIIDIGGESTRPATFRDHSPLSADEELNRILPVLRSIRQSSSDVLISIDSYKASVLDEALRSGADIVNDISGLLVDPSIADVAAKANAPYVLMHIPGPPRNMPDHPHYDDVVVDIAHFFERQIETAISRGVKRENIILDPGLGFGKNADQNYEIIRRLSEFKRFGLPILSGPSRKRFIGEAIGNVAPLDRDEGTFAAVALSIANGADIVRVHNVKGGVRASKVADRIMKKS
jgi:dihydropteroate synthase